MWSMNTLVFSQCKVHLTYESLCFNDHTLVFPCKAFSTLLHNVVLHGVCYAPKRGHGFYSSPEHGVATTASNVIGMGIAAEPSTHVPSARSHMQHRTSKSSCSHPRPATRFRESKSPRHTLFHSNAQPTSSVFFFTDTPPSDLPSSPSSPASCSPPPAVAPPPHPYTRPSSPYTSSTQHTHYTPGSHSTTTTPSLL